MITDIWCQYDLWFISRSSCTMSNTTVYRTRSDSNGFIHTPAVAELFWTYSSAVSLLLFMATSADTADIGYISVLFVRSPRERLRLRPEPCCCPEVRQSRLHNDTKRVCPKGTRPGSLHGKLGRSADQRSCDIDQKHEGPKRGGKPFQHPL